MYEHHKQPSFKVPLFVKRAVFINISCVLSSTDKKNTQSEKVPVDADVVLAQREKELNSFLQRKQQMDTLIKMIAKVTESITGEYS